MNIGKFEVHIIPDGNFWLDGGGMFGVVPKVLWEKKASPDDRNRIKLGLNALLVRTGKKNFLIETGIGSKSSEKFRDIYHIEGGGSVLEGLRKLEVRPDEIDGVILTHLHFDHAGGCTLCENSGRLVPTFPKARYFIQHAEWQDATHPNALTRASYLEENFVPLEEAHRVEFLKGDAKIEKGIRVQVTGGHTRGHQIVWLESEGERACFLGDFIPTTNHLRLPWLCAYDLYPKELVDLKAKILKKLVEEKCRCFWYHDPEIPTSFLAWDEKGNATVK